jgi:DNA mismatch repair protein MutS
MSDLDLTPIRQQYLEIKRKYPDAILFFRLGDFYETFDQDAEITSHELDIVLTSRAVAKGNRVPMAGIPFHAMENYLSRLIDKGYHVAICEQMGDQPVKGLFAREVIRIVTPGTLLETNLLSKNRNNYLVCIITNENKVGVAYTDISTGEFSATEIITDNPSSYIKAELSRLQPSEILIPNSLELSNDDSRHISKWDDWRFEQNRCKQALLDQFQTSSLDGFGLRGMNHALRAAGGIVQYLKTTQPTALPLLTLLHTYHITDFMILDAATRRNLELTETIREGESQGSLLFVIDHTITAMGHRLIRQWFSKPLLNRREILKRQNAVEFLFNQGVLRAEIIQCIKPINDLERLTTRIIAGQATPHDLVGLRESLKKIPFLISILKPEEKDWLEEIDKLDPCERIKDLLIEAISENPPAAPQNIGVIRVGYSKELDDILDTSRNARDWIANLETKERSRTGIKSLKVGYNKIFGYFIEVTHSKKKDVPSEYIRKQTLVNAERYITPEMKEYESKVFNAEERIHEIETRIFKEVCLQISELSPLLLKTSRAIAMLDVICSFAESAALEHYVRPEILDDLTLDIHDGRHPVVEHSLFRESFIPNDVIFEDGEIIRVITGPNMSGKSTFLRQTALIVFMAQIGSFVPATKAKIGLVDRIFTRIGAQDEISAGQSTFMVEMTETANILHHATEKSLLILDEIGRGTSTYDGLSIAWAVVEYIHNHPQLKSRTLFATHFHELIQLSKLLPGVRNFNIAVTESGSKVIFMHKIIKGGSDRSYGIHVAQLAGLPAPVIQRAGEIIKNLETSSGDLNTTESGIVNQMALFPETNPLLDDLSRLDLNALSPIEALTKLYEWQKKYIKTLDA